MFPYAIQYGMSTTDFWDCSDPSLFWAYRASFNLRDKRNSEYDNYLAWLSGLYVYKAVRVVIKNGFGSASDEPEEYFSKPINFNAIAEEEREDEEERKNKLIEDRIRAMIAVKQSEIIKKKKIERSEDISQPM